MNQIKITVFLMERKRKADTLDNDNTDNYTDDRGIEDQNQAMEDDTNPDGDAVITEIQSDDEEYYKEIQKKKKKTRLSGSGPKSAFTGTDNDRDDKLDQILFRWLSAIKAPKKQNMRALSLANWNDETNRAEVFSKKGKYFQTMGVGAPNDRIILYIEEALYLVDNALLELYYHSVPMSCQQVFHLLDRVNFPIEHYQVYSYLRRFGYIIMRTTVYDEDEDSDSNSESNNTKKVTPSDVNTTNNNNNNASEKSENIKRNNSNNNTEKDKNDKMIVTDATEKKNQNDAFWQKIQLISPATSKRIEKLPIRPAKGSEYSLHYDVFKPSKRQNFKKTDPGQPSFRVSICIFNQAPPSVRQLEELSLLSHPVPVKFCVVNDGIINLLGMQPIITDMVLS